MYYIVNKLTNETVATHQEPFNIDPDVQPEDPFVQLVRVDNTEEPLYDRTTHKLTQQVVDDFVNFTRTFSLVATPITNEEKDNRKAHARERNRNNVIKSQLASGQGTLEERVARLEAIILQRGI